MKIFTQTVSSLLITMIVAVVFCYYKTPQQQFEKEATLGLHKYCLIVVATTPEHKKDTLTNTYVASNRIDPILEEHFFDKNSTIFIKKGSFKKIVSENAIFMRVLKNGRK